MSNVRFTEESYHLVYPCLHAYSDWSPILTYKNFHHAAEYVSGRASIQGGYYYTPFMVLDARRDVREFFLYICTRGSELVEQ